jgi:hypothetical protein
VQVTRLHRKGNRAILVLIVLLGSSVAHAADTFKAQEEGFGDSTGLAGRRAAIADAEAKIVMNILESLVATRNFRPYRTVIEDPAQYILGYQLLEQQAVEDGVRVKIEAEVDYPRLRDTVARLTVDALLEKPRVLVLATVKLAGAGADTFQDDGKAEGMLAEALVKAGVAPITRDVLGETGSGLNLPEVVTGDTATAARLAGANRAEAALLASIDIVRDHIPSTARVFRNRARMTVRVITTKQEILVEEVAMAAVVNDNGGGPGILQSVQDACDKIAPALVQAAVLGAVREERGGVINVTILGARSADRTSEVVNRLSELVGLDQVQLLHESDAESRLRVTYRGPIGDLANAVLETNFSDFELAPRYIVGTDMTVTVEPKSSSPR